MKDFSNTYTYIFSATMVVIVALLLSLAALKLKPFQDKNIEVEKKQNILAAINIQSTPANAVEVYNKYIKESFVVNSKGDKINDLDAFKVDMKVELSKPVAERALPVFVSNLDDGQHAYVVPVRGKGLWGPIWGYISFEKDLNTIYGANFDHQGETPGLGAEIRETWFQKPFIGKKIFEESDKFVSVKVIKGGADPNNLHQVDAISGGTITSKGLEEMLDSCLITYKNYFIINKQ